jgi:ribosomal-protein-alanine N-acetyltransferase
VSVPAVIIAPARRADGPDLVRANALSRDYQAPWVQTFTDPQGFEAWFDALVVEPRVSLVARAAGSGEIVGVINLSQIFLKGFRNAYVGFYGMAGTARRGLMTEALRLATRYAFDEIGLHRLEANIQPANAASIALARRVGFRKEGFSPRYLRIAGEWRDHERWTLLAEDTGGETSHSLAPS